MQHPNQEATLPQTGLPTRPQQDSDYDHMLPWQSLQPAEYDAPDGSWESRAIRQATVVLTMPRAQVQQLVRPNLPQIAPKNVRPTKPPTVAEVLAESARLYPDSRTFLSGSPAGYSGTPRYQWGMNWG